MSGKIVGYTWVAKVTFKSVTLGTNTGSAVAVWLTMIRGSTVLFKSIWVVIVIFVSLDKVSYVILKAITVLKLEF